MNKSQIDEPLDFPHHEGLGPDDEGFYHDMSKPDHIRTLGLITLAVVIVGILAVSAFTLF